VNRTELQKILVERKLSPLAYSLDGGLPNEKYVLERVVQKWSVYYSERGQRSGEEVFETEDAACQYMLKLLANDSSTRV
jgi:hypothetical protein